MKINYIKIFMVFLLISFKAEGQSLNSLKFNVDSLFQTHFFSLDTTMECGISKLINKGDIEFVYLIGYLSGIKYIVQSYSGHPILTIQNVLDLKKWYWKNKNKIDSERIHRGLLLLRKGISDEVLIELEKLRIY